MNYYNEIDEYAAQWIRNLIAAGEIPYGVVDTRSIEDIKPNEIRGYTQCHFFAGIAGWSLALRLAGISDDQPIWTGSCPCQPFSAAGAGAGFADERHLWPAFEWLIAQCQPPIVTGEQVASSHVNPWIDLVRADLEALGYAFAATAFPSAGVGAPHIRDRSYWVGHAHHSGLEGWREPGRQRQDQQSVGSSGLVGGMVDTDGRYPRTKGIQRGGEYGQQSKDGIVDSSRCGPTNGFWSAADWLACRDDRWRPVEPGAFPLAHGISGRMGRLRAYGNAINPHQAAEFLRAALL